MNLSNDYEKEKKQLKDSISSAVSGWFKQACQNPDIRQFVFYKPNALQIYIGDKAPNELWQQVGNVEIPSDMTQPQAWQKTYESLQNCPVYPV